MNILDVNLFFNTLLSETIVFPEKAALYRSLGFEHDAWPECQAKRLMGEFEGLRKDRGDDYARFTLMSKIKTMDTKSELPEEQGELSLLFDQAKTYGQAYQLSEKIRSAPLDLEKHIDEYRKKRSNKVETFLFHEAIDDTLAKQMESVEKNEIRVLIPGWEKLSKKVGGFNPGRVSMLVAKTGVGKTMLALNLAVAASEHMATIFFNMEMAKRDIISRLIQAGAKIKSEDWYSGNWNFENIGKLREEAVKRKPIIITDGRALTLNQILGQIVIAKEQYGVQIAFIDYDQKIRLGGRDDEWRQVQRAVEEMEEVAKGSNVHIMLLAQGDDDGEVKSSKRAQQPAATIFEFTESNGAYGLKSKKNRFGKRKWSMKVNCSPEMSLVTEGAEEEEVQMELDAANAQQPVPWYVK